jgi:lysophospholipase L1-like esterase
VIRALALVAVQILIVLVLLEIGARIFDPLGISYYPETARFFDTMIREEPISYRLKPGLDANFHHARYQVNSIGLRGPEIASPKPAGESRILWLGDSIVFGIGVNYENTLPALVERTANESTSTRNYRVVNMGVPSYNTEQELIQLETVGLKLQPDAVMLLFAVNDIEAKGWVFDKRASWAADFAQRSYALSTLFVLSRFARQSTGTDAALIHMDNYEDGNPRWRAIADSLARIKQICDQRSIPFIVLVQGSVDEVPYNMVAAEGRKSGFEVFGLRPEIDPRWPDASAKRYRNSLVDSHCNAAGCEMWATLVYEHLVQRGIIQTRH